jgi:hypothetical protein
MQPETDRISLFVRAYDEYVSSLVRQSPIRTLSRAAQAPSSMMTGAAALTMLRPPGRGSQGDASAAGPRAPRAGQAGARCAARRGLL